MNDVSQIDKSNFRQFIIDTPNQYREGFELAKDIKLPGKYISVTISGMGGSALPANLLRTYCNSYFAKNPDKERFQIYINRYYSLPPEAYDKSLNIIASYSGNTEETISALNECVNKKLDFIGISSNGKVETLCKDCHVPHIKLPVPYPNYQPRMGTGYFFGSMLKLLINQGLIPDLTEELLERAKILEENMERYEMKGKELADKMKGKTPVIYSSPRYKPVAMVWKIKINENAKTPAFWNFLPEANHNEMVGFTNPQADFLMILLRDPDDHPRNIKRYDATSDLLKKKGIESVIIDMEGEDVFQKIFSSITIADWASYYLALAYNQDPTPVEMVEELKKILA